MVVKGIKTNYIKHQTIDPEIWSIFGFKEKGLGIVSPPHFVYDFSRKTLHSAILVII